MKVIAGVGLAALLLAGCAGADGPSGVMGGAAPDAPVSGASATVESATLPAATGTPVTSSATAATGTSRAAPILPGREKTPEPAYPTFGAPAQIGDRPVLTKEQRAAMQKNLEGLASQREKEMLNQIEADQ